MKTKYQWKMDGFLAKMGFDVEGMQITQHIAENIFQLDPSPPELSENTRDNDYILKALETKDLRYFSFFLHKIEKRLNRYIRRTLTSESNFRYDPEGFLEIKLCCMMCLLQLLPKYEPGKDDVSEIIWHEIHANAVRKAFDRLTPDEKEYLQRRNALCMKCGCARNIKYGESFDDLGAHFELTTAGGAEKAYRKAVDHLTRLLVEDNAIGTVTIKRQKVIRRKKKIAAAVYEYQADYDGEWGELEIDFEKGTGKISYIAELDTTRSHRYANKAIEEILNSDPEDLPKQKTIAFPK